MSVYKFNLLKLFVTGQYFLLVKYMYERGGGGVFDNVDVLIIKQRTGTPSLDWECKRKKLALIPILGLK